MAMYLLSSSNLLFTSDQLCRKSCQFFTVEGKEERKKDKPAVLRDLFAPLQHGHEIFPRLTELLAFPFLHGLFVIPFELLKDLLAIEWKREMERVVSKRVEGIFYIFLLPGCHHGVITLVIRKCFH